MPPIPGSGTAQMPDNMKRALVSKLTKANAAFGSPSGILDYLASFVGKDIDPALAERYNRFNLTDVAPSAGFTLSASNVPLIQKAFLSNIMREPIYDQTGVANALARAKYPRLTKLVEQVKSAKMDPQTLGAYYDDTNDILINADPTTIPDKASTIMHEFIHALQNRKTPGILKSIPRNASAIEAAQHPLEQRAYKAGSTAFNTFSKLWKAMGY